MAAHFTNPKIITPRDLAALIRDMLVAREGEVLTQDVARERANNIACALQGVTVTQ